MSYYIVHKFSGRLYVGMGSFAAGRAAYTTDVSRARTYTTQRYARVVLDTLPPADKAECYVCSASYLEKCIKREVQP